MILLALPQRSKFGACQMEDEGRNLEFPPKSTLLDRARGCAMTHVAPLAPRNEAEFSTELEIHSHSRLFGEKRNSSSRRSRQSRRPHVMGRWARYWRPLVGPSLVVRGALLMEQGTAKLIPEPW